MVYISVPSINLIHSKPCHYYIGMTPTGLGGIVKQAGFEILDIGFYGNKEYIEFLFKNNDWPNYTQIKNYTNDINCIVCSWIFAKKIIDL